MQDMEPFASIAASLQNLIEAVQGDEDRMSASKRAALERARRYRVELMTWVASQRER